MNIGLDPGPKKELCAIEVNQAIGDLSTVGMYTLYSIREMIKPVPLLDILLYKYSALYLIRGGSLAIFGKALMRMVYAYTQYSIRGVNSLP